MVWDNMVSTSCETFINSNPATSPSWFSGRTVSGRTMSKMCRISLWMPRDTGRRLWIRAAGRRVSRAGGISPASSSLSRQAASNGVSPLAMPPPTRLSSLSGSMALCRLRRPIQKCQPPSVCTSPLRWTAWLMSPSGRKAARSNTKRTLPASPHTSNFSSRQPCSSPRLFHSFAKCCKLSPIASQLSVCR